MTDRVSKEEALGFIRTALEEAEAAIRNHRADTVAVYETGSAALAQGMGQAEETDWSRATGLQPDEFALIHRYLAAVSFISAWYAQHRMNDKRDAAAQTCAMLVSAVPDLDDKAAFMRILQYERAWKEALSQSASGESASGRSGCVVAGLLILAPAIVALLR